MRRVFLIFLMSLAVPAFSQSKRPFTFEDMMKLKRVGEPEVSPDGKWVIFSVVDVDLNANTKTPHIWIVPTAGGQEREIIADQDADRPRWAPDGKRFAFISNKEGGSQVWAAEFDETAGTATGVQKLTSIATEADGELWSPDGGNILFVSSVYPECPDEACNARKLEEATKSNVKAMMFTGLLFRHVNAYTQGKRSHIFVIAVDACLGTAISGCPAGAARDLTPGDYDSPVSSFGQDEYAFSPDGQEICYTSNHDKNEAASTNNDLWIVSVNGARTSSSVEAKNITADNPASDSTPLYSPDGKYIAYRAQQRPGYESDRFRLMLYDRKTGEKKNLTESFDRWVGTFAWHPDSQAIYYVSEDAGSSSIRNVVLTVINGNLIVPGNFSSHNPFNRADGYDDDLVVTRQGVVYTKMHATEPTEIYKAKVACTGDGSENSANACVVEETKLTHLNDATLARVLMSPLESFWFTGAHGDKVQGFIGQAAEFRRQQEVSREVHPQGRAADRRGRFLELQHESRTLGCQRIRGHHHQLPRLDRLRPEVH